MSDMGRAKILVRGRVQGVFFRDTARRMASGLGLDGTVRNLPEGDVEIIAEGSRGKLDDLILWCRTGPPAAVVEDVQVQFSEATGAFEGFRITY